MPMSRDYAFAYSGEREHSFWLNVNTLFLTHHPPGFVPRVFTFSQFPEVVFSSILLSGPSDGRCA
jgi:hypothetical protein